MVVWSRWGILLPPVLGLVRFWSSDVAGIGLVLVVTAAVRLVLG